MSERRLEFVHTRLVRDSWLYPPMYVNGVEDAVSVMQSLLHDLDREVCAMLNLTTHGQVINASFVSMGTINSSILSPPEVFRNALLSGATSIVLLHNHPSGFADPSELDRKVARCMVAAGKMIGINVLDFIVLGGDDRYSFLEEEPGTLNPEEGIYIPSDMAAETSDVLEDEAAVYNAYERLKKDRRSLVDSILEKIRDGGAFFTPLWSSAAVSARNPISSAVYQGGNRLILMNRAIDAGYRDPRWMTFAQLSAKGYHVKKGERGTRLEKWIFTKKVKDVDENGRMIRREVPLERPFPSYFTVFNAEQVDGFPPLDTGNASLYAVSAKDSWDLVDALEKSSECPVRELPQDRSFYRPSTDEIVLPLRSAFLSAEAFGHVMAHEMIHSTGHESRLMRTFGRQDPLLGPDENYCVEELRAELGSLFLTSDLGIADPTFDIRNSAAYVEHYLGQIADVMDKNPGVLFRAASDAERACRYLKKNLEKELTLTRNKEEIPAFLDKESPEKENNEKKEEPPSEAAFSM